MLILSLLHGIDYSCTQLQLPFVFVTISKGWEVLKLNSRTECNLSNSIIRIAPNKYANMNVSSFDITFQFFFVSIDQEIE